MQKTRTTVRIAGKEYTIASYDSEAHVNRVAAYVDRKMSELAAATRLPAAQLAVLAAVNATDDMIKSRDEIDRLRKALDEARDALEKQPAPPAADDETLTALRAEVASGDEMIARLQADAAAREETIAHLQADLAAKDALIARLRAEADGETPEVDDAPLTAGGSMPGDE